MLPTASINNNYDLKIVADHPSDLQDYVDSFNGLELDYNSNVNPEEWRTWVASLKQLSLPAFCEPDTTPVYTIQKFVDQKYGVYTEEGNLLVFVEDFFEAVGEIAKRKVEVSFKGKFVGDGKVSASTSEPDPLSVSFISENNGRNILVRDYILRSEDVKWRIDLFTHLKNRAKYLADSQDPLNAFDFLNTHPALWEEVKPSSPPLLVYGEKYSIKSEGNAKFLETTLSRSSRGAAQTTLSLRPSTTRSVSISVTTSSYEQSIVRLAGSVHNGFDYLGKKRPKRTMANFPRD